MASTQGIGIANLPNQVLSTSCLCRAQSLCSLTVQPHRRILQRLPWFDLLSDTRLV